MHAPFTTLHHYYFIVMAQGFALLEEELLFEEEILEAALLVEYWLVGHVCCYCCGTGTQSGPSTQTGQRCVTQCRAVGGA